MSLFVDVIRARQTPPLLSSVQIAHKIGVGMYTYPRSRGVLVPRALADICGPSPPYRSQDPREMGREVVRRLERAMRHLPRELLDVNVPHPSAVLHDLPIEPRTRGVLERFHPAVANERVWTVGDYLRFPRFGARCLVDLLSACEEARESAGRRQDAGANPSIVARAVRDIARFDVIDLGRLDEIALLLEQVLPISGARLGRRLVDERLAMAPVTLEQVAAAFKRMDRQPPFRIITRAGEQIAVAGGDRGLAATIVATAAHMVWHWGLSTVGSVVERVGGLRSAPASRILICRLLEAVPRLCWLDDTREWFSLKGDRSRLARSVAKVFAVARQVPLRELRRALAKGQPRALRAPAPVLERYLRQVAGCQVNGPLVVAGTRSMDAPPVADEAILVGLLESAGAEVSTRALGAAAAARAIPAVRVLRLLRESPLFVRTGRHRVRLVGHAPHHV